jgi:hypothetical protein
MAESAGERPIGVVTSGPRRPLTRSYYHKATNPPLVTQTLVCDSLA